jgi:hypothetical protein
LQQATTDKAAGTGYQDRGHDWKLALPRINVGWIAASAERTGKALVIPVGWSVL